MIRKLLCLLGFHKWEEQIGCCSYSHSGCEWLEDSGFIVCKGCKYCKFCKYCGRAK